MHARTTRTLIALAAAAAMVVTGAPADAVASDVPVTITPTATTFTVTGNGFGHGHGMSQWGAKGAAQAGLGYQQILAFYYPGTTLAAVGGKVRVRITEDTDDKLTIAPAPGLRVHDLGNGRTFRLRKSARAWRLKSVAGQTRVYYKTGRWHLYRTAGRKALKGDGEFRSSTKLLTLKLPTGNRVYRGKLRLTNTDTVNVVLLDKYLRGVIPSEMPASWHPEALKAQAVAARTYAVSERAAHAGTYYDLCDTAACQVYRGVSVADVPNEQASTNAAADATAGQTLVSNGQYAFAQFSSSNGGWSSAGDQPYLVAQADPYDQAVTPYKHWRVVVDAAKIQAAHPELGTVTSVQINAREGGRLFDAGGWVQNVHVTGTGGSVPFVDISGSTFRSLYGLRSAYFTFDTVP